MADHVTNKKTIDTYKGYYEYFTGKASDLNRSLAIAGIAIIWIYKTTDKGVITIPDGLIWPLMLLVISLSLDLLQYVIGGLIWFIFYRVKEYQLSNNIISENDDIKAHWILSGIIHFLYWAKLVSMLISYYYLFDYLLLSINQINK